MELETCKNPPLAPSLGTPLSSNIGCPSSPRTGIERNECSNIA